MDSGPIYTRWQPLCSSNRCLSNLATDAVLKFTVSSRLKQAFMEGYDAPVSLVSNQSVDPGLGCRQGHLNRSEREQALQEAKQKVVQQLTAKGIYRFQVLPISAISFITMITIIVVSIIILVIVLRDFCQTLRADAAKRSSSSCCYCHYHHDYCYCHHYHDHQHDHHCYDCCSCYR